MRVHFLAPGYRRCLWGMLLVLLASRGSVFAQRYQVLPGPNQLKKPKPLPAKSETSDSKTVVSVELVAGKEGVGYQAQMWRPLFEEMGVDVQIRTGNVNDKPEIKEESANGFRRVTVIGELDRQGRIVLSDRI